MIQRQARLGLIVIASETGLGYQTRDYYNWLKPDKTILIDISGLNGCKIHEEWYNPHLIIRGIPNRQQIHQMLDDIDILLTAETPYNLDLYDVARGRGVKTISVENPEFYDHIKYPAFEMPDLIILPSIWKMAEIKSHAESRGAKVIQLHHPVDRLNYPFKLRTTGRPIHIAGKPATSDRNGTWEYLQACPDGLVTTQSDDLAWNIRRRYRHSDVRTGIELPQQIYSMGDILVLPRKYGGNCLPLNEALSSGMPVIMPDIEPNYNILPDEWLVPAYKTDSFTPRTNVDIYTTDIEALSERIEWVAEHIESESQKANDIANTISWDTLLPRWQEAIASVL